MTVDFGKTAADYRRHRAGFPDEFFWELRRRGIGVPGQVILDLGTGTGTIARGLAASGSIVSGIDVSQALLDQAAQIGTEQGVTVEYRCTSAETLSYDSAVFDVVTAGQCWHWFKRERAAAEAFRVLKPGGRLIIAYFDWLPLKGNVVAATEALILAHNPAWHLANGTGIHPQWCADVALAGLTDITTVSFDVNVWYSHERWRGRIRASAGVAASLAPPAVEQFDQELAALLSHSFTDDPLPIPHRVWMLFCMKPY